MTMKQSGMMMMRIVSVIKWLYRLVAKDASLSRSKPEFDSLYGHHEVKEPPYSLNTKNLGVITTRSGRK